MVSNYNGICQCIEDDFKYFCDVNYLKLREAPKMSKHIPNQNDDEMWIYNTYYNFAFNHESPYHGSLYVGENWTGPLHFVNDNFKNFISRYTARINNFRNYLNGNYSLNFVTSRYNASPIELFNIIKHKHPNLQFKIYNIVNFGNENKNCLYNASIEGAKQFEIDYLKYMNVDESSKEYERYLTEFKLHEESESVIPIYF
jgi:hypothetical protein